MQNKTDLTNQSVTYTPPSSNVSYTASLKDGACVVESSTGDSVRASFDATQSKLVVNLESMTTQSDSLAPLVAIEHLLGVYGEATEILVRTQKASLDSTLGAFKTGDSEYSLLRSEFYQLPFLWLAKKPRLTLTERWTETQGRAHPVRTLPSDGIGYSRFYPQIGKTLSYRRLNLEQDLELFHNWHNQARVSEFWELNQTKEQLREYLAKQLVDTHQSPWIVEADGKPVAYFELYYTPEDRLGPYYNYEAHDRGFHFLIGERSFLGLKNTDAVIKSALHFLFIDDPRTRNVMAEPRSDNTKILRYVEVFPAWKKLREFDFPHKRAALLECRRERFFSGTNL